MKDEEIIIKEVFDYAVENEFDGCEEDVEKMLIMSLRKQKEEILKLITQTEAKVHNFTTNEDYKDNFRIKVTNELQSLKKQIKRRE